MTQTSYEKERQARLSLWRAQGIGPSNLKRLISHFGSAVNALDATGTQLREAGVPQTLVEVIKNVSLEAGNDDLTWLEQASQRHILLPEDVLFPQQLLTIKSAPPLLFVVGNAAILNDPQLAMVGTRNPSTSGREIARSFAAHLASNGLGITSGLAIGIDSYSHQGALDGNGSTIAVIGTGLDIIYPARNTALAARIIEQGGAIVSEFPIGTKPQAQNFPRRNRIISGLSVGTLVVEATLRSGSLVTAQHANEQGREVFAIPGSIYNPMSRGCHQLIRQGAKLVETANDILEEIPTQLSDYLNPPKTSSNKPSNKTIDTLPELDSDHLRILSILNHEPLPIDQIIMNTGLTTDVVSSILLMLELQGYAAACGGGHYMRVTPKD